MNNRFDRQSSNNRDRNDVGRFGSSQGSYSGDWDDRNEGSQRDRGSAHDSYRSDWNQGRSFDEANESHQTRSGGRDDSSNRDRFGGERQDTWNRDRQGPWNRDTQGRPYGQEGSYGQGTSYAQGGSYTQGGYYGQEGSGRDSVGGGRWNHERGDDARSQGGFARQGYAGDAWSQAGAGRQDRSFDRDRWDQGRGGMQGSSGTFDQASGRSFGTYGAQRGESWRSEGTNGWSTSQRGPHFGKGPKGYKRSDERIKEDVSERLSQGHVDASDIEVQVKDGEVTLSGSVPTREMKRLAEEIIEEISGVRDVANQVRVKREEASVSGTDKTSGNGDTSRKGSSSASYSRS